MADAALSALVSDVLRSLASIACQEFGRLWRLKHDVSALKDTYTHIQAVLNDAEVKQKEQKDVEVWLKSLRSASLEVENIIDDVLTEAMLQRLHKERGFTYKVRAFLSSKHNPLMVRTRVANKVKTIRRTLDKIEANRSQFNFISDVVSVDSGVGSETINMETTSLVPVFEIFGRDAEVKKVAREICNKDIIRFDTEGVQVYAIWGMGGVGKTTLAQLVYNHESVKAHFELQSWVYVSNDFQIKKITKEIIESIDKRPCEVPQLDAMQVELHNKLKGKRFIIVLDDVWMEDKDMKKWEELSKALSSGAKGSIVMVTTRDHTTSRMMAKVPQFQHQLGCLSKEDSWSLFKKLAFASGSGSEGENIRGLESLGKKIVHKCQGLPLAVKTLGGLMWSKSSVSEWQSVKDSDVWELQENNIMPALKLSYDNLLPHLKRCFAYCCLFPKGYKMSKHLLIELWMANGFLPPREEVDLYVIGNEIFYCLVSRSFLQDVQEDQKSAYLVCKMHDLMHDLARDVMKHDCFVIEPGKELITPDEVLHFSSSISEFSFLDQDLKRLKSLRSIHIFVDGYKGNIITQISKHVYLRVLCLDGLEVSTLPESICKLKHLRYLSICRSEIVSLPESIIYLQNLQVLLVEGCTKLEKLPEGMKYMKNLRCLDNEGCQELDCMPVGMKKLACLQRLGKFIVDKEKGARLGELGDLSLLGGRLALDKLENVEGLEEAKSANLKEKTNLISLVLCWSWRRKDDDNDDDDEFDDDEDVLRGLEPNSSLKELRIQNYMGEMISPSWIMNLGNLVKIRFWDCRRCESIPSLGKLPGLRVLELWGMNALKCLDDDEFPSLYELNIQFCDQLAALPSNFPKLKRLDINWAPDLASLPSNLPKLSELRLSGCPQLHRLPHVLKELTSLTIMRCKNLQRRYEKKTGEDWSKISHVPVIHLRD